MAERGDQGLDDLTGGLPESEKRLGWSSRPRIGRVLESYCRGQSEIHIHPWVRLVEGDRVRFCAVFQYAPFDSDVVGSLKSRDSHVVWVADKLESPEMKEPVLVLVPQFVERQDVAVLRLPSRVRLQRLDECRGPRTDTPDEPQPGTIFKPGRVLEGDLDGFVPPVRVNHDREARSRQFRSVPVEGQLVDDVVESGTQVVDGFTENDPPHEGDRLTHSEMEGILGAISIYVGRSGLERCSVRQFGHFTVEGFQMFTCPLQLEPDTFDGVV